MDAVRNLPETNMKVFWKMPPGLKVRFNEELNESNILLRHGNFELAWRKLERSHILGQSWAVEHTYVHWKMLLFAFRIKNTREIFGQLPRILVGGVKSYVGKIPVGNTGGANVPPLKSMPVPADIKELMKGYL